MENVWLSARSNIEKVLTPQNFANWIKPIRFLSARKDHLLLEVPDTYFRDWIRDNYLGMIKEAISSVSDSSYEIELKVVPARTPGKPDEHAKAEHAVPVSSDKNDDADYHPVLNPLYTFDTFVCGAGNRFAHAAALAVGDKPGTNYNPLFIYGGVGLGKTHLLVAIGNHILSRNRKARISYYSSEKFMNEMINCIRYKKMDEFRSKFRKADVLLIDDIQFMAGKEATQEEFFHTFNSLHDSRKQIVVTSDKIPKDIPELEERLRTRFEWGLIADIQPPDVETRIAILKKKAEQNGIPLPDDVALFLGSHAATNVRELEGMLLRLGAISSLTRVDISLAMAREALKEIIVDKSKDVTIEMIQKQTCEHFHIKVSELKSEKRLKTLVFPRQIAMFLCRELTKASYPEIGEKFGGKDHSTIIHSAKKIEKQLAHDLNLKDTLDTLRKALIS
jgi:chromosomal replication initiator protein